MLSRKLRILSELAFLAAVVSAFVYDKSVWFAGAIAIIAGVTAVVVFFLKQWCSEEVVDVPRVLPRSEDEPSQTLPSIHAMWDVENGLEKSPLWPGAGGEVFSLQYHGVVSYPARDNFVDHVVDVVKRLSSEGGTPCEFTLTREGELKIRPLLELGPMDVPKAVDYQLRETPGVPKPN